MININFLKNEYKIDKPLYKYFSNYEYAEDTIVKKRIHIEKFKKYNDIFDGRVAITKETIGELDNKDNCAAKLLIETIQKKNLSNLSDLLISSDFENKTSSTSNLFEVIDVALHIINIKFPHITKDITKEKLLAIAINAFGGKQIMVPQNLKASCFSENKDSLLMWAYYANNYKGICVEYDFSNYNVAENNILNALHKVQYSKAFSRKFNGSAKFFTKSLEWSHEQEWRLICDIKEDYIDFPYAKAIYLGYYMPEKEIKKFKEIGKENHIDVYQVYPSTETYELMFHKYE